MLEKIASKGIQIGIGGLIAVAGVAAGWFIDHRNMKKENSELEKRVTVLEQRLDTATATEITEDQPEEKVVEIKEKKNKKDEQ